MPASTEREPIERLLRWPNVQAGDRIVLEALDTDQESFGEVRLLVLENWPGPGHQPDVTLRVERSEVFVEGVCRQSQGLPEGAVVRAGPSGEPHLAYFGGIKLNEPFCLLDVLEPNGLVSREAVLQGVRGFRLEPGTGDPDAGADEADEYRLRVEAHAQRLSIRD